MRPIFCLFAGALLIAACATSPAYRQASAPGEQGFDAYRIENNRWRVSYTGDETQTANEVRDLALLRAADLTLEQDADWFEVVANATTTDRDTRTRFENRGFETDYELQRDCGLLGCTTRAQPVTRYGGTDTVREDVLAYDQSMEIMLGYGPQPRGNPNVYDASETAGNLRARLGQY
ncbi:CC0125/CC1285 family lipoprotein [Henriciella aquimarina]|uniref:CC0125/CC1285 family lipoprotein n=1 Tax=Henriciella aquimarina TaxID=545261 RepID=UPI000A04616C|nr:hypothetical protein [Henriciella aquimarina]